MTARCLSVVECSGTSLASPWLLGCSPALVALQPAAGRLRGRACCRALPPAGQRDRHRRQQPDVRHATATSSTRHSWVPGSGDASASWTKRRSITGRRSPRRSPASRSCSCATADCCRSTIRPIKYVPELRDVHNPFGDMSQVTIRHLMSHSAGLARRDLAVGRRQAVASVRADALVAVRRDVSVYRAAVQARDAVQLLESRRDLPRPHHRTAVRRRLRGLHQQEPLHAARHDAAVSSTARPITSSPIDRTATSAPTTGVKEQRFDFDTGITVSNGGLERAAWRHGQLAGVPDWHPAIDPCVLRALVARRDVHASIRAVDGEGGSGDDVQAGLS